MNEPFPPRRRRRYLFIVPALVLVLAAAVVAAAPTLLSTDRGRSTVLGWVNGTIPGTVSADDVSLSWLGGQSLQGLEIRDAEGQVVLAVNSFRTDLSLLEAAQRRLSLGQTVIQGVAADLRFDADGTSNLAAALGGGAGDTDTGQGGLLLPITGNMALIEGRVSIAAPGIKPVTLENLSGAVEITGTRAPIRMSLGGRTRQGNLTGSISVNGRVSDWFTDGRLTPAAARADVQGSIQNLPVDAVDRLLNLQGALSAALGDRATLRLDVSGDASRQDLTLSARAPNGELSLAAFVADGRISLVRPASARLTLTPALVEALKALAGDDPGFRLAAGVPLHLTVEQLAMPIEGFSLSELSMRAGLDARESIRFTGLREVGDAAVNNLRLVVDSAGLGDTVRVALHGEPVTRGRSGNLSLTAELQHLLNEEGVFQPGAAAVHARSRITGIPTSLLDTALGQDGLLLEAVGPVIGLSLDADTGESGRIDVSLAIDSARLNTDPIRFGIDEDIALSEPARVELEVTPGLWSRLLGGEPPMQLTEASTWALELRTFRMPVPDGKAPTLQPAHTALHATLIAPAVALHGAGTPAVGVQDLKLDITADTLEVLRIDAVAALVQPGGLLGSLDASPLGVGLDVRTGLEPDASMKAVASSIRLESPGLKTTVNTTADKGFTRLQLSDPAVIDATITPALLAATRAEGDAGAALREAAGLRITLESMVVPLVPFDYAGISAEGDLALDTLAVETAGGALSVIENTRATFQVNGADGGRVRFDLNGRVKSSGDDAGDLSLALTAGNLVSADGRIGGDKLSLDIDGKLQQLPTALLDQLLGMDGLVVATLGNTSNLTVNTQLDRLMGPVSLALDTDTTRADIQARIGDEGLTLAEPLEAQLEPTPEFGQKVLSKVHPIFETTQRAEQPIRLEVPTEGVRIPVEDYAFDKIAVPSMTLDFGRIVLKSGWLLRGLVGLGQQFGRLENVEREEWVAWFTPGVLQMRNGEIVYTRRLDLLLDQRLHLATWGRADIAGDRSNLTLAFMPGTMERVFSITVAEDDALRIPVTGPLSSPSIDFKKTAADLARLRAQEEASGNNPLAGLLLGSLTGQVSSGGPVPPASVSPLPWAGMLREADTARQPEQPTRREEQAGPKKKPTTEEQVIKGLIDIFGKKKTE